MFIFIERRNYFLIKRKIILNLLYCMPNGKRTPFVQDVVHSCRMNKVVIVLLLYLQQFVRCSRFEQTNVHIVAKASFVYCLSGKVYTNFIQLEGKNYLVADIKKFNLFYGFDSSSCDTDLPLEYILFHKEVYIKNILQNNIS